ncbi:MAG TPA: hypothetical protein VFG04_28615 [Planctomycetaceae bacterium]|nr:hypothetical protein [Planctomycetaceae bacterium]
MRRSLWHAALVLVAVSCLSGCFSFWSSSSNRSYDVDLGKLGSGEQVIASPNEGKPWQGDAMEHSWGW